MKRILAAASAAILLTVAAPGGAEAAKPKRLLATPSNVCSAFVQFGAAESFGACVGGLRKELAAFWYPSEEGVPISLYQQCAGFEASFVTYPFFFEEPPGWPFPEFTAQNRNQCAATLYAYHTLVQTLGPPPPGA